MDVKRRQIRRPLWATVITLLALCLASAPAVAQQHRFVDPAHDVVRYSENGDQISAPHRRFVDIRQAVIRHGAHRIAIRLHVRDLKVRHFGMSMLFIDKRTKKTAGSTEAYVRWHPKHPHRADVYMETEEPTCVKGPGPKEGGDGIRLHTNYRANDIHLSFPRRCIGGYSDWESPWIRANIQMLGLGYGDEVSYQGTYPPFKYVGHFSPRVYAAKQ